MAGFEPTTLWFVARYSIQLSYIRTRGHESYALFQKKESLKIKNTINAVYVRMKRSLSLPNRSFVDIDANVINGKLVNGK